MRSHIFIIIFSLIFTTACQKAEKRSDAEINSLIEKWMEVNPGKVDKIMSDFHNKKQDEQRKAEQQNQQKRLEDQIKNPIKVEIGKSPVLGPETAPITIIEFSDFECPFCSRGTDTMKQVIKKFGDKVRLVYKHQPLPFHQNAGPAALASFAAEKQGKFWPFHDRLFEEAQKKNLNEETYKSIAKELGLDMEKFNSDYKSEEVAAKLKSDKDQAQQLGVQGTPAFFVNGVKVEGAYPFEYFDNLISRLLKK